jgi:hypothetical protein
MLEHRKLLPKILVKIGLKVKIIIIRKQGNRVKEYVTNA